MMYGAETKQHRGELRCIRTGPHTRPHLRLRTSQASHEFCSETPQPARAPRVGAQCHPTIRFARTKRRIVWGVMTPRMREVARAAKYT
jgi:hypothetical protein